MRKLKRTSAKVIKPAAPKLPEDCSGCESFESLAAINGIGTVGISCAPNGADPTHVDVTVTVDTVSPPPGGTLDSSYPIAQLRQPPNTQVAEKQMIDDGAGGFIAEFPQIPAGTYFAKVLADYIISTVDSEVKTSGNVSCSGT